MEKDRYYCLSRFWYIYICIRIDNLQNIQEIIYYEYENLNPHHIHGFGGGNDHMGLFKLLSIQLDLSYDRRYSYRCPVNEKQK